MGAVVHDGVSKRTTHIFAANSSSLREVDRDYLKQFEGVSASFDFLFYGSFSLLVVVMGISALVVA